MVQTGYPSFHRLETTYPYILREELCVLCRRKKSNTRGWRQEIEASLDSRCLKQKRRAPSMTNHTCHPRLRQEDCCESQAGWGRETCGEVSLMVLAAGSYEHRTSPRGSLVPAHEPNHDLPTSRCWVICYSNRNQIGPGN